MEEVMSSPNIESKRRRVTRACDTCRQKKVKCDGKQPCIHCTVYSYSCTYDQPNIRNKKHSGIPHSSYPRSLVATSSQLTSHDSTKNTSNLILFQNVMNLLFPKMQINILDDGPTNFDFERFQQKFVTLYNRNGNVSVNELLANYLGDSYNSPMSPRTGEGTPTDDIGKVIKVDLPTKDIALQLIYSCWNKACVLFRYYHRPSLLDEMDLLYSLDPLHYTDRQQKFLPFFYSILAVGSLFSRLIDNVVDHEILRDDGYKYFLEARKLIDITDVGDIISIQTIVLMILYLQCSARLSTCYSYIGIGLRSALKEGLHRNLVVFQDSKRHLDPIESDTRKRLFFTIYKMDIYINSLLGLPQSLAEDEFDQILPEELDDENITRTGFRHDLQQGKLSSSGCANHHTRLMIVMSHIVKQLYPIKIKKPKDVAQTPNHMHKKVSMLELQLKEWLDQLPKELKPVDPNNVVGYKEIPETFTLANYYLHLSFLNCQIMLYRPFIHFISHNTETSTEPRSLIRGRNCIKVARSVVKLANKMIDENLLTGTYWFSMYTIFFSIACLIYYYHYVHDSSLTSGSNYAGVLFDDDLNIDMIRNDIEIGKKVLDSLKSNSNASMRIYEILNKLFEQLNQRTANSSKANSDSLRKINQIDVSNSKINSVMLNFTEISTVSARSPRESNAKLAPSDSLFSNEFTQLNIDHETSQPRSHVSPTFHNPFHSTSSPSVNNGTSKARADHNLFDFNMTPANSSDVNQVYNASPQMRTYSEISNSSDDQTQPYLPGVMDTLDAEVFGKLLPPYMLEQDQSRRQSMNYDSLADLIGRDLSNFDYNGLNDP